MTQSILDLAGSSNTTALKALLEAGADPNESTGYGNTALHNAVMMNSLDDVKVLLQAGADPNKSYTYRSPIDNRLEPSRTALMYARSPEVARLMIASGANVNHVDGAGLTPLMTACWWGLLEVVEVLLQSGARTDIACPSFKGKQNISASDVTLLKRSIIKELPPNGGVDNLLKRLDGINELLTCH